MYRLVPMLDVLSISLEEGTTPIPSLAFGSVVERPKSAIFTLPFVSRRMFEGFKSNVS